MDKHIEIEMTGNEECALMCALKVGYVMSQQRTRDDAEDARELRERGEDDSRELMLSEAHHREAESLRSLFRKLFGEEIDEGGSGRR